MQEDQAILERNFETDSFYSSVCAQDPGENCPDCHDWGVNDEEHGMHESLAASFARDLSNIDPKELYRNELLPYERPNVDPDGSAKARAAFFACVEEWTTETLSTSILSFQAVSRGSSSFTFEGKNSSSFILCAAGHCRSLIRSEK